MSEQESPNGPFDYNPNVPMSYVVAILFAVAMIATGFQYFKHRTWFFWCMLLGVIMEAVGYIARIPAIRTRHDTGTPVTFIISFVFILLAPSFMAAGCYMAFGRLIFHVTPARFRTLRTMWVPARWITPVFVLFDVFGFLIQAMGGIRVSTAITEMNKTGASPQDLAKAAKDLSMGYTIAKTGVIVQLLCFGFFTFVGARILFVANRWRSEWPTHASGIGGWRRFAWAINAACALILFRAIFRLVEFLGGAASDYIMEHEVFLYVFDALPMLVVFGLFLAVPPHKYLPELFMKVRYTKVLLEREAAEAKNGGGSASDGGVFEGSSYYGVMEVEDGNRR